ncbi:MAG: mdh [Dehalococcoidia bacterium]|nr:mdh [Dehalococcoidia bacterium]
MRNKVTVVGAGNVGATCAQYLFEKGFADVVLADVVKGLPQGKALDLSHASPILNTDARINGTNSYEDTAGSDVVVITAGVARKPGMSRDDLLLTNARIVRQVTEQAAGFSPESILIVVSNPLDAMTYLALHTSRFPRQRVLGMSGALDSARFRSLVAMELGASVSDVSAIVLGGHGDAMVPLPRLCTVGGIPLESLLPPDRIERLVARTINAGAEIVALLQTGSAYYAPGAAIAAMVEAILLDRKRIMPCAVYLDGEYGIKGTVAGVPVKLGRRGVEEVIELELTPPEMAALKKSAEGVKELINVMQTGEAKQ